MFAGLGNYARWLSNADEISKPNSAGRSRLQSKMKGITTRMKDGDPAIARIARLEFMKFNLAYEMASAFQGGTGGRTISDQDIENMMAAMNFGTTTSETSMISSLQTIQGIMKDVATIQGFYSKGGRKAAVGLLLEKTNSQFGIDFSGIGNFADYAKKRLDGKQADTAYRAKYKSIKNPNFGKKKPNGQVDNQKRILVPK